MSVAVKGFDGNPFDQRSITEFVRYITTYCQLVFTGTYPTGGDTLDFTNNNGASPLSPNTVPPTASSGSVGPSSVSVQNDGPAAGLRIAGGTYAIVRGTNPTNWKIKVFTTGNTELAAGAYPASSLADTPILESVWAR